MTGNQACNDNDRETQTKTGGWGGRGDEMMMIERKADINNEKANGRTKDE